VTIDGDVTIYNSAILEVVTRQRCFVLDELVPARGHRALRAGSSLEVRAIVDGIELRFHTRVVELGETDGLPHYTAAFPELFTYAQRRGRFRVPAPLHHGYEVALVFEHGREVSGELRDLSPLGLSARVRAGRLDPAADLHARVVCRLDLAHDQRVLADLELRHIGRALPPRVPRFGARFVGMTRTAADRIERFCDELEHLRRNPGR
jgi:c-di-GMP-binding flagellar brake protein YcgR